MNISTQTFLQEIKHMEQPITFHSLENFNKLQRPINSKDIINKVQEMLYTGEWTSLYTSKETEDIVNNLCKLELVIFPPSYIVYNAQKSDITVAENTTELNDFLNDGYYVYCKFTDYGFEQKEKEDYYQYMIKCTKEHIPDLYSIILSISQKQNKPLDETLIEYLDNK